MYDVTPKSEVVVVSVVDESKTFGGYCRSDVYVFDIIEFKSFMLLK